MAPAGGGAQYIQELFEGHPDRFYEAFGMTKYVFRRLATELFKYTSFTHSKYISMAEQLAIFLHFCRYGQGIRKIEEEFMHSPDTISKIIHRILNMVTSQQFYTQFVKLPPTDQVPPEIQHKAIFYPFFKDCLGALDGTHIYAHVAPENHARYCNRKGTLTQNVLAACTFDLRFSYVLAGWEGSAHDGRVFEDACRRDLVIPEGKYYLADAGFSSIPSLLVPYRGVRYHLKEWGQAEQKPKNKEELFNLRHAQARNAVERIFGLAKRRFRVLTAAPEYDTKTQAKIVLAVCCLHNFIQSYDPDDGMELDEDELERGVGPFRDKDFRVGTSAADQARANARRDQIANEMWESYQTYTRRRSN
ncbi:hypothetical protein ACEPAG_6738 [Sanghuangporus baumii]